MSKELRVNARVSGLTLVARVYDPAQSTTAQIGSDIAMSEIGTSTAYYGDMAGGAGKYSVIFLVAATGVQYGEGWIDWSGTAEILQTGDTYGLSTGNTGVNANITHVNGIAVRGTGQPDNTWGP